MNKNRILKIAYYIFLGFLGLIAVILLVSIFSPSDRFQLKIVQSGSMEPAIKTGSVVAVISADDYKIGDIITFKRRGEREFTSHRIVEMRVEGGEPVYTTQGDANNAPDLREVRKSETTGKIVFSVPYIGYIVDFAQKPMGFVLIIAIPAVIIIADEIKKIIKEVKKKSKDKKQIEQAGEIEKDIQKITNEIKEDDQKNSPVK